MHSRGCVTMSADLKLTWMCFSPATSMIATKIYFSTVILTSFSHYIPLNGYECWYCDWGHLNSMFSTCIASHWFPICVCRAPVTHEDRWPTIVDLHYPHTVPYYIAQSSERKKKKKKHITKRHWNKYLWSEVALPCYLLKTEISAIGLHPGFFSKGNLEMFSLSFWFFFCFVVGPPTEHKLQISKQLYLNSVESIMQTTFFSKKEMIEN